MGDSNSGLIGPGSKGLSGQHAKGSSLHAKGSSPHAKGFSLIELMIVIAILGVVAGIAIPAYQGYIETSQEAKLLSNIATIEVFQEDYRLRNGAYETGAANLLAITQAIGWEPQTNDGTTYSLGSSGDGYTVTATDTLGNTVCMIYPDKNRC